MVGLLVTSESRRSIVWQHLMQTMTPRKLAVEMPPENLVGSLEYLMKFGLAGRIVDIDC